MRASPSFPAPFLGGAFTLFLLLLPSCHAVRFGTPLPQQHLDRSLHSQTRDILRTKLISLPDDRPAFVVGEMIEFELFDGALYFGDVTSFVMRDPTSASWFGDLRSSSSSSPSGSNVDGVPPAVEGEFELSCDHKACVAHLNVFSTGDEYIISPADNSPLSEDGEGTYQLSQYSQGKKRSGIAHSSEGFVIDHNHLHDKVSALKQGKISASSIDTTAVDTDLILDCFVMYTQQALSKIGGSVAAMKSKIYLANDSSNKILERSGVSLRLRVVGIESAETGFLEPNTGNGGNDFSTLLSWLQSPSDGKLDAAHMYRDLYGADLVLLVNRADAYAGLGYVNIGYNPSYAMANYNVDYVYGRVWMHEIGHILGCYHDRFSAALYPDPNYIGYGNCWEDTSKSDCTCYASVMVYDCNTVPNGCTSCSSRDFLANKYIYDAGSPTGEELASCGLYIHERRMWGIAFRQTVQPGGILNSISPSQVVNASCFTVTISGWQIGTGSDIISVTLDGVAAEIISQTIDNVVVLSAVTTHISSAPGDVVVSTSGGRVTTLSGVFSFISTTSDDVATFDQADLLVTSWESTGTLPWSFYAEDDGYSLYKDGGSAVESAYAELTSDFFTSSDPSDGGCSSNATSLSFSYWANSRFPQCYGPDYSYHAFSISTRTSLSGSWVVLATVLGGSDTTSTTYTTLSYALPAGTVQIKFLAETCSVASCANCRWWAPVRFDSITVEQVITCTPPESCVATPTQTPTSLSSATPSSFPSFSPTGSPVVTPFPSQTPTFSPSLPPTLSPSVSPSAIPSSLPSSIPTPPPTVSPTRTPSSQPTLVPSVSPSFRPTTTPSVSPSMIPTFVPSEAPTVSPSAHPSVHPSFSPSLNPTSPTFSPSLTPTFTPTATFSPTTPTLVPTTRPTNEPTLLPSCVPTTATSPPTPAPSFEPTFTPSDSPSLPPSLSPSLSSTIEPTACPSISPSLSPSQLPTLIPSVVPTSPTTSPTFSPFIPPLDPTMAPSHSPTFAPSSAPVVDPTPHPTKSPSYVAPEVCLSGDRSFCSWRGYCSSDGTTCVCDDVLHYWPSEQCSIWHAGGELEVGQYCSPGKVDYYCSWLGTCNEDGSACNCFDPDHRSSSDRCSSWSPTPPPAIVGDGNCVPGDRSQCNNRGYCDDLGVFCVCDDPLHYWSSERCELQHFGPQLEAGECCSPDSTDYYCAWMGVCNSDGTSCLCYDSEHRLPSERCQFWHQNISDPSLSTPLPPGTCPPEILKFTASPSLLPTLSPSIAPTISVAPSLPFPTWNPTVSSSTPTTIPSTDPTLFPSSPPTFPPTVSPTITPTLIPTVSPTASPTHTICIPGDRGYCNNRGMCDVTGGLCVCDDVLHYWPSEQCSIWHAGGELEAGQYCFPGKVDYYCSWLGTCNDDGSACNCFDPDHRSSSDRCSSWSPEEPIPGSGDGTCLSGSRGYCFNRGFCNSAGNGCVCDDPLHYWSSERCQTSHYGPELVEDECCSPNKSDYYCGWLGTCDSDGLQCVCEDSNHRLPSERCSIFHETLPSEPPSAPASCPALLDLTSDSNTKSSESSSNTYPYAWPYWTTAIAFIIVAGLAFYIYRSRAVSAFSPPRNFELVSSPAFSSVKHLDEEDGASIIVQSPYEADRATFHMLNPLDDTSQL